MLDREIIAVFSQIHTKHINTVCGQNVELLNVKLVVHILTIGLQRLQEQLILVQSHAILDLYVLLECRQDRW